MASVHDTTRDCGKTNSSLTATATASPCLRHTTQVLKVTMNPHSLLLNDHCDSSVLWFLKWSKNRTGHELNLDSVQAIAKETKEY